MPPSTSSKKASKKPELTMEQRYAIADARESLKLAKEEKKKNVRNGAKNKTERTVAKYEKLAQKELAKIPSAPGPALAPAPAPAPAPIPAPAVTNLVAEAEASTEEEN